jgi:HD domain
MSELIAWATNEATQRLAPLGRRLNHVLAVADRAQVIGPLTVGRGTPTLATAALLHDIGYAPELATTGFHPLDGARFCRALGHPEIASLVAHHSSARHEAEVRGLLPELLAEFPYDDSMMQRTLTYCDLTTSPDGTRTNVKDRVSEIVERYGPDHVVSQAIQRGHDEFLTIEAEIEALLAQ